MEVRKTNAELLIKQMAWSLVKFCSPLLVQLKFCLFSENNWDRSSGACLQFLSKAKINSFGFVYATPICRQTIGLGP